MAKLTKKIPASKPGKGKGVAKGKLSPVQAAKLKHKADAVLGKHDGSYHNC